MPCDIREEMIYPKIKTIHTPTNEPPSIFIVSFGKPQAA